MYICPKCRNRLMLCGQSYKCSSGHCFDVSAKGYVNLLMSGKSGIHGDSKEMLAARREFLALGHYKPIIFELSDMIIKKCKKEKELTILDAGCGEGYYTGGLYKLLTDLGYNVTVYGIDVSKDGVAMAAKKYGACRFSVASVNALPFPDCSFDVVISLFAPIAEAEFRRVLRDSGMFVTVSPAPRHLYGLKKAIYDCPYENEETTFAPTLFNSLEKRVFDGKMLLNNQNEVDCLFKMTPYYHKTDDEGKRRVSEIGELCTEIGFMFYSFMPI